MSTFIGILAALIAAVGWGSYFVPMKRLFNYDFYYYQALMCVTIFFSSLIVVIATQSLMFSYWGIISGFVWSIGNFLTILAVKHIGLSRTAPIIAGIVIVSSFLWGTLFFKEPLAFLLLSVIAIFLLITGIILVSVTTKDEYDMDYRFLIVAVVAGLLFGSYAIPLKISNLDPITFLLPMSTGILLGGLILYFIGKPVTDKTLIVPGIWSGLIWNVANFASFFAIINVGLAVGFPLTQLAMFVSVIWGLVYFREIVNKQKKRSLIMGAVFLFVGVVFMSLSV